MYTAANLLAAADALCPSSSDVESSSSSDGEEQEDGELVDQKKNKSRDNPVSSLKNKKQHLKTKRAKKHPKKSKEAKRRKTTEKGSLSKKERRRLEKKAEFSKQELAAGEAARKSSLHPFSTTTATETTTTGTAEQQVFYSEKSPDPGNVAFGKLYRFDVPRYRRHDPTGAISNLMKTEADRGPISGGSSFNTNVTTGSKNKKIEKQKERKEVTMWWRPTSTNALVASANDSGYLPLDPSKESYYFNKEEQKQQQQQVLFLSPEEYVLQKTRDFNYALRQTPENLQIWLDFAAFQDEAMEISNSSSLAGSQKKKRGVLRATAEKQISILERGLQHHPGSDVLFLALLDVASKICDHEEMEKRWQQVLVYSHASVKLWKAFLMQKRNNFAVFKVGEVAAAHYQALYALKNEKMRVKSLLSSSVSEQHQGSTASELRSELADLDNTLVEIALLAISFHFQAGYSELSVAVVRAVLEFNWFAPEGWPEDALEMMFEEFYRSEEAKMLGDSGASGWGAWISGDLNFENTPAAAGKQQEAQNGKEEEPGGWVEVEVEVAPQEDRVEEGKNPSSVAVSPWEELAPAIQAGESPEAAVEEENEKEEEETDEQLLARLGMDLDAVLADAEDELTPQVLSTWLDMESQRDSQQWKASRKNQEQQQQEEEDAEDENTNPFNLVAWEDLSPYLISIQHKEAREKLLIGCLQLLGVSLSPCLSSSLSSSLVESEDQLCAAASWLGIGGNSLEAVDPSALGNGRIDESHWAWLTSGRALRAMPWWAVSKERHEVVLKILTTLLKNESLKDNYELSFATLDVASWSVALPFSISATQEEKEKEEKVKEQRPTRNWAAGRSLAKQLLSEQRENIVLYAAFAALERLSGRAKAAKKVYLACFQSGEVDWSAQDAAVPAGLLELVLGVSQLELEETSSTRKSSSSSISFLTPISMLSLLRATPEGVHAAARCVFFLGSRGKIPLVAPTSANSSSSSSIKQPEEEIIVARRGYQDTVLRLLRAGPETLDSQHAAAVVSTAAAAELIFAACINNIGGGVTAALALYKQVIEAVSASSSSSSMFLERIVIQRCALAVNAAVHAVHVVPPTLAREILSSAMQRYPSSPPLLRMLRSLEVNAHALTALRRQLNSLLSSSPSAPAWLMLIGVEIGANASRTAILTAFMRAVTSSPSGMHSPLLWRCFLRFERAFGTPESLHRTFLRAVEACPWSKSVWYDGLKLLNGYCSPKELSEYLEILKNKEFPMRTDVLEAVLAGLE
jgi:hypothetical protein